MNERKITCLINPPKTLEKKSRGSEKIFTYWIIFVQTFFSVRPHSSCWLKFPYITFFLCKVFMWVNLQYSSSFWMEKWTIDHWPVVITATATCKNTIKTVKTFLQYNIFSVLERRQFKRSYIIELFLVFKIGNISFFDSLILWIPYFWEYFPQHLLHKSKVIAETIWKYLHISTSKFLGNYSRKYGICFYFIVLHILTANFCFDA